MRARTQVVMIYWVGSTILAQTVLPAHACHPRATTMVVGMALVASENPGAYKQLGDNYV